MNVNTVSMFGIIGMELIYHTITTNSDNIVDTKAKQNYQRSTFIALYFRSNIDMSKKHVLVFCLTWYDNGYTNETIVDLCCGF
jgi:hypothetical protein